jgi:hypothetical protein
MIVVADTSPRHYLVLIDEIDLLSVLFGQVLLPQAVHREMQHLRAPLKVRAWAAHPPNGWRSRPWLPLRILLFVYWTRENARPSNWRWSWA